MSEPRKTVQQPPDPPVVRLKRTSYTPTKAELDEPIILRNADGSRATPEDAARAILRDVRVVHDRD